jgi:hypothetical protein
MMKTYGVLGTGATSKNVIEDALNELGEDNEFLLYGAHKMSASESRVHSWVTDHEVSYTVLHDNKTSPALMEDASAFVSVKEITNRYLLKELKKRKGTLLMLWDEENNDEMEQIVFDASDLGIKVLDLTNGLTPIGVEGDESLEEPVTEVAVDEVEIEPFSKEELEKMPISVLKKNAKNQGMDVEFSSKEHIIQLLIGKDMLESFTGADPAPKIASDTPEVSSTVPNAITTYTTVEEGRKTVETSGEQECMVTVVMPNGTVVSTPATMAEVRLILGFG